MKETWWERGACGYKVREAERASVESRWWRGRKYKGFTSVTPASDEVRTLEHDWLKVKPNYSTTR